MAPVNVHMRQDMVLNVYPEPSFRRALVEPLRVIVGLAVGLPSFVRAYEMAHGKEANPDLPLASSGVGLSRSAHRVAPPWRAFSLAHLSKSVQ